MIEIHQSETRITLPVRVTPQGGKDAFLPFQPGDFWIKLKVKDPPEDGKANTAVIELLSKTLGIPKRDIQIIKGETSRLKQVTIQGVSREEILAKLAKAIGSYKDVCFKI